MANYWTHCWKCEAEIKTQEDCNYLKTRHGDFSFCPTCYKAFLDSNTEFIMPEKIQEMELEFSLRSSVSDYHEKLMKNRGRVERIGTKKLLTTLQHSGDYWGECPVCLKMLKLIEKVRD